MKSRVSKLVSVLCVVSMLASALPVSALAVDGGEHGHDVPEYIYVNGAYVRNPDAAPKVETAPMRNAALFAAPRAASEDYIHNFTTQGDTTNGFYTNITGNLSSSKGTVTYNGLTLTQCLKIESSTSITVAPTEAGTLTLVSDAAKNIKVDGKALAMKGSPAVLEVELTVGQHTITKGDTMNLFYMEFKGEGCDVHTFGTKYETVKEATCTEKGARVAICTVCGAKNTVTEETPALGHEFNYIRTKEPTCASEGAETATCSRCDAVATKTVPATGAHNYVNNKCAVCGLTQGQNPCATHTMKTPVVTPATCTDPGDSAEECSVCGMTIHTVIPATGHDWSGTWQVTTPASCTVKGEETLTCKNGCGQTQKRQTATIPHTDADGDGECDVCHNVIAQPLKGAGGWFELLYVDTNDFTPADVDEVSWTGAMTGSMGPGNLYQYDKDFLVRSNGKGGTRIDVPGVTPGDYTLTVTVKGANYSADVTAMEYDRSGYAHWKYSEGVGAYRDDGILKDEAIVLYVTDANKDTVELEAPDGTVVAGIGHILNTTGMDTGSGTTDKGGIPNKNGGILKKLAERDIPLVVRIVGDVTKPDGVTKFDSVDYGGSVGDNGGMVRMKDAANVTIEGIGPDACVNGWGIHFMAGSAFLKGGKSFEVRNIAFRNVPEDCIGMEGIQEGSTLTAPVERCWIHNCSFFVPQILNPAESDKAQGDGACDFKRGQYMTMSYCHFDGYHKTNLVGSSDTSLQYNITWHHNLWENCESRGPLGRQANIHIYNCIYDGNSSYAQNTRANCYIFSEYNTFVNCKQPRLVKGGAIKSYNDVLTSCMEDTGATEVTDKGQKVSSGNKYENFDTNGTLSYIPSGNYKLDKDHAAAKAKILAYAGPVKAVVVKAEDVDISVVDPTVKPTTPITLPLTVNFSKDYTGTSDHVVVRKSGTGTSTTLKLAASTTGQDVMFLVDEAVDITVTDGGGSNPVSLINESGAALLTGSGTVKNVPAGIYMLQSSNYDVGSAKYKDAAISGLKVVRTTETNPHVHNFTGWKQTVAPTCTRTGVEMGTCSCGETDTRELKKLDHNYVGGECSMCHIIEGTVNDGSSAPDRPVVPVTGVTISPSTGLTLLEKEEGKLTATVTPADATNKAVAWSSSDTTVARVGRSGVVTAVGPGECVITAQASDNHSASVAVKVIGVDTDTYTFSAPAEGPQGDMSTATVSVPDGSKWGRDSNLVECGYFTNSGTGNNWQAKNFSGKKPDKTVGYLLLASQEGGSLNFTVATGATATAMLSFSSTSSSNTSAIALIGPDGSYIPAGDSRLAVASGTATTTVTYAGLQPGTYKIVAPKAVQAGEVDESWSTFPADANNPNKRGTRLIQVQVDENVVSSGDYVAVDSVSVTPASLDLTVGGTATLAAKVSPDNASNKAVSWSTDDPRVATVGAGLVTARGVGTTSIRATAGSKTAVCQVKVTAPVGGDVKVTSIKVDGPDSVAVDGEITLTAVVAPEDATDPTVSWTVNDTTVALINSRTGRLTGRSDGVVVVTATAQDGSNVYAQKRITVGAGVKPVDKTNLENVLNRAKSAIESVPVAEKAEEVAEGTKWVPQAAKDTFQAAITAAQGVYDKQNATVDEINTAVTTLTAALTDFAKAAQDGTKPNGGDTPTPGSAKVLESKNLTAFAAGGKTDGQTETVADYFTIIYSAKSKVDNSDKEFNDGYKSNQRLSLGGKGMKGKQSIKFTTAKAATVKIWWVAGDADRQMAIFDENTTVENTANKTNEASAKNGLYCSTLNVDAGTWYLGGTPDNNYIFKVEVTETSGSTDPTPPTPGVDRTELDKALADAQAALDKYPTSKDGSEIDPDKYWVSEADKAPLQSAIALAGLAFTQEAVDAAVDELKSAIADLDAAKKFGTKITTPDTPVTPDNPGGGGGGGGGGSTPSGSGNKITNTFLTLDGTVKDNVAVAELTDAQAKTLTSNAVKNNSSDIIVAVKASDDADAARLNVSANALKDMASRTDAALNVQTDLGDVRLSAAAVADLGSNSGKDIAVILSKTEGGVKVTVGAGNQILNKVSGGVTAIVDANGSGSVAYLTQDGKETLLKKSYVEAGMLHVSLPGSGEIVLKDNTKTFRDVENNWAKSAIDFATSRELFNGVNELDFAPNQEMTRSMLVTVLYRLEGVKSGAANKFADVPADSWYTEAVAWANAEGIVSGKSETHFGPDDDITREQLATILYRYATKLCGMSEVSEDSKALEKFSDQATVSGFAADGMKWCVEQGIIGGRGDGTLAPGGFASRAEVATMLMRFVKAII